MATTVKALKKRHSPTKNASDLSVITTNSTSFLGLTVERQVFTKNAPVMTKSRYSSNKKRANALAFALFAI